MGPPKTQTQNLKYNLEQLGKISNYYFLSDDALLFYHRPIGMLLLTAQKMKFSIKVKFSDKLKLTCYVIVSG